MIIEQFIDVPLKDFSKSVKRKCSQSMLKDLNFDFEGVNLFDIFKAEYIISYVLSKKLKKRFQIIKTDSNFIFFPDYVWVHDGSFLNKIPDSFKRKVKWNILKYPSEIDVFLKDFNWRFKSEKIFKVFEEYGLPYDMTIDIIVAYCFLNIENISKSKNTKENVSESESAVFGLFKDEMFMTSQVVKKYNLNVQEYSTNFQCIDQIISIYREQGKIFPISSQNKNLQSCLFAKKEDKYGETIHYSEDDYTNIYNAYNEMLQIYLTDYMREKIGVKLEDMIFKASAHKYDYKKNIVIKSSNLICAELSNTAIIMQLLSEKLDDNTHKLMKLLTQQFLDNIYIIMNKEKLDVGRMHEKNKKYIEKYSESSFQSIMRKSHAAILAHSDTNQLLIIPYSNLTIEKSIKASAKF